MEDKSGLLKGYFILVMSLFIFTMWGVNLFSLSEIEIQEASPGGKSPAMGSSGGVSTITMRPKPFLFFYLRELGYSVEFSHQLPAAGDALMLLIAPPERMASDKIREIIGWVRRGGNLLVFLPRPHAIGAYLGSAICENDGPDYENLFLRFPYTDDVRSLSGSKTYAQISPAMSFILPFKNELRHPTVLTTFRGGGQISIFTNKDFLVPDGMIKSDNLVYLTRMVDRLSDSRTIWLFDPEPNVLYRARVKSGAPAPVKVKIDKKKVPYLSLWSLIKANPISWALPQLALALILYFYSRGRRFGRPLPLPREDPPHLKFIEGLGRLLREQGNQAFLIKRVINGFLADAGHRFGLQHSDEMIATLLERISILKPDLGKRLSVAIHDLLRLKGANEIPTQNGEKNNAWTMPDDSPKTVHELAQQRLLLHLNTLETARKELKING